MADAPRVSQVLTSPSAVAWSNSATFDGYLKLTLSLPTGYSSHKLKNTQTPLIVPRTVRIPIAGGVIDVDTRVYYNADINPPGTTYTGQVYDTNDTAIGSAIGSFSVTAAQTTVTIPTLTVP